MALYPPVEIQTSGSALSGTNPIATTDPTIAPSVNATGTAAAPGAGSAFVTTAALPVGWYRIRGWFAVTGAVETAAKNVRLSMTTGGTITDFPTGMGITALVQFTIDAVQVTNANDTIKLTAIAAATASTVYTGTLSVYRIA